MNNAIRTIAALLAGAMAIVMAVAGCTTTDLGVTTCTASWLTPQMTGYAVFALTWGAVLLKAVRPGGIIAGMFGATAIVSMSGKSGTVMPNNVK